MKLLVSKADPMLTDVDEQTPLDLAVMWNEDIIANHIRFWLLKVCHVAAFLTCAVNDLLISL